MELTNGQKFALARAMKKSAEELENELRPIVDREVLDEYLNSPQHPDRVTFAFANENGFAEVGRLTIKKGKGSWVVADPDAFNAWALEAGVAIPSMYIYPHRVAECAKALDAAGLQSAYYIKNDLPKDFQKGFADNNGAAPVWAATGEVVDGLEWAPGKLSTMVTGCTMKQVKEAERVLGAPIIGSGLLPDGGAK